MSGTTFRFTITAVLLFHGVGHAMGVIPALRLFGTESGTGPEWFRGWSSHSWLLNNLVGDAAARAICTVLFLAALIGFVCAALGLLGWLVPHEWWRTLAAVSAVISLVAVVLFWNALICLFPHRVGAIGVDIATLVCLLWAQWPSESAIGF